MSVCSKDTGNKLQHHFWITHQKSPSSSSKVDSLVFATDELAQSCGQGLATNRVKDGSRKPLDQLKIQVMKSRRINTLKILISRGECLNSCEKQFWLPPCSLVFTAVVSCSISYRFSFMFTDYFLSFCVANSKDCPTAKQMNEVFTQQVSYSRRKQQRADSRLDKITVAWSDSWLIRPRLLCIICIPKLVFMSSVPWTTFAKLSQDCDSK